MKNAPQHDCQFKLRLSREMREWLQAQANASRRTLTAEIQLRLQWSRERPTAEWPLGAGT